MFRFFRNENGRNPIAELLGGLSDNQKMSVINLLLAVAVSDEGYGNQNKELEFLNNYLILLNVSSSDCMAYLELHGRDRISEDLRRLTRNQKEFLVIAAWDMINCDGKANEVEVFTAVSMFGEIGINEDDFVRAIEKSINIINNLNS